MKKTFLNLALAGTLLTTFACNKEGNEPTPDNNAEVVELSGNLETMTLDASKKYLLVGQVFVQDGKTLTIPAGTVIMGDEETKAVLIINEGGKIEAKGTKDNPVVFTSELEEGMRDRGDWGGVIILGRANINQNRPAIEGISPEARFGSQNNTANDNESSGSLEYVRIEYAGIAISPNNEVNSLTMGAVGRGTKIENVQVSFGGDDGFEWFGGTVNCKNLISYSMWDDNFDVDFGYSGNVQFGLAINNPQFADVSGSNGFEVDNDATGSTNLPFTAAVFSNMTVIGPMMDINTPFDGQYKSAVHIRRRAGISIYNSVFTGFPTGIKLDARETMDQYVLNNVGELAYNTVIALGANGTEATPFAGGGKDASANTATEVETYWTSKQNDVVTGTAKPNYAENNINENWFYAKANGLTADPDFSMNPVKTANFESEKLKNAHFTQVPFRGAFGADDWTNGWSNFDPNNASY
jgi:hypothetical protein